MSEATESWTEQVVIWHRMLPPTRPEEDDMAIAARWAEAVRVRGEGAGGRLVGAVGGTLVFAFEQGWIDVALDFALAVLDEAEDWNDPPGGVRIAMGAATGVIEKRDHRVFGAAFDHAQLLAGRARRGEIVLDGPSRDRVSGTFLFGRTVNTGTSAHRGVAIDRTVPKRSACRAWIKELRPAPVPPSTAHSLAEVSALAGQRRGSDCVLFRTPAGSGVPQFIEGLIEAHEPSLVLHFAGVPGGLEPLGSLRLALSREWGSGPRLEAALGEGSEALGQVARGHPVDKARLYREMHELLERLAAKGRAWFVFESTHGIDPTTLGLVAGLARASDLFVLATVTDDEAMAGAFSDMAFRSFQVPELSRADARVAARAVLGDTVDDDVVRRVAALGGETVIGVEEAAKTLVSSGDLVHDGVRFRWRIGPRPGARAITVERLIGERLENLDENPLRMLDAICVSPPGTPRLLGAAIAERDGLAAAIRRDATRRLAQEGFLAGGSQLQPSSEILRRVVLKSMAPERRAEMHRFVAEAMRASSLFPGPLSQATTGHFLSVGGDDQAAGLALMEAARGALSANMRHAARRLAAASVALHDHEALRKEAAEIARQAADEEEIPVEVGLASRTIRAILDGDFDVVDDQLDLAVAEGGDLAAAHRMRAMLALARGDTGSAFSAFEQARAKGRAKLGAEARASLTLAWILLHDGDIESSVRAALAAL
ncbi:MAG: hypothetical protein AAF411_20230, partial [Myxococcota bacterium]